jgi:hypothetical protein
MKIFSLSIELCKELPEIFSDLHTEMPITKALAVISTYL